MHSLFMNPYFFQAGVEFDSNTSRAGFLLVFEPNSTPALKKYGPDISNTPPCIGMYLLKNFGNIL